MATSTSKSTPKLRKQERKKRPDLAFVVLAGQRHYVGPWGSPEAREHYARLIREWNGNGQQPLGSSPDIAVNEILARWWIHAGKAYTSREPSNFRPILSVLAKMYGRTRAADFGPLKLDVVREILIEKGLSRGYINGQVGRARHVFRWAGRA